MSESKDHHFKIYSEHDVMVFLFLDEYLRCETELDEIFKDFRGLLEQLDMMKVVIDFSRVKIVSSIVLGKLVVLNNFITSQSGKLVVCNANIEIKETMRITRLDEFVEIIDDREKAIMSITDSKHRSRIMPVLFDDDLKNYVEERKIDIDKDNNEC